MTTVAQRFARTARWFRRIVGAGTWTRWGMTFAEALVMIVVAGTLMMPVVGTLQSGVDRTNAYVHQDRMRTIAQASMTSILAGSAYARTPVVDFTATVTWPINDPEPVATYVMEVETIEGVTLATLTSEVKGDFAGNEALLGSQPANLKTVVVTVTHVPDLDDIGIEPAQVRLFSMVATPRSFNPNRIYIADKDNICVYAVDPLTKNVVETFDLPFSTTPKTKTANNPFRPGNIAVHPNGNWVLTQREASLLLTDVGLFSPTRRTSVQVYATTTALLENASDNEAIRKDRGVAFRPDGRYCYVTSHAPSGLSILSVPDGIVASFSLVKFLPISTAKFVDLQVGEDGYIYIGDYDYASKCFRRLNMFAPQNLVALENYSLPGWLTSPNKKAMAACTSRDGRRVYSVWEGAFIASSSSDNPADWGCAEINYSTNPGGEDIQDVQVSGDDKVVIATSKQGGGKTRIFAMPTELRGGTITTWSDPPNRVAYPGSGDITNQAILSPAMNEVWVDRKAAGEIYALDTPGLLAGSYTTAIPADRTVLFLPSGDAGCVTARMSEMIAVACDGPVKTIEFIDPWSKHHYENLTRKLPYAVTPSHLAFDGSGSLLSVCYTAASTLPTTVDVFNSDKPLGVIDPENWGATVDRKPTHHVYYQNGGCLIQKYGSSVGANGYVSFDASGTKQADVDFPLTSTMSDVTPLPDGGALVLVTDFVATWTRLDWIGPDASVYAKWDSRFDAFPPHRSTRMAISADGGLLALYAANYNGATESVHIYDFRSRNFGTLTQQTGLICDFRSGSKIDFAGPVPANVVMTGTTYKLKDNFTCNDPIANMVDYPANFYWNTSSKYGGVRTTRFFGYLRIPEPVKAIGLALRDGGRFSLDGGAWYGHQFENTAGGVWSAAFDVPGLDPPAGPRVQFDKSTQGDDDLAMGPFFSLKAGGNVSDKGTTNLASHSYTALGSSNSADWKRIPKTFTVPLRITPPHVFEWTNGTTNTGFNRFYLTFGRDVSSSTLYLFNAETSWLFTLSVGGSHFKTQLASITANTGLGLAITPDGQMLMIPAKSPGRVYLADVSMPARASYLNVIDSIDLPQTPAYIAVRPFNRIISRKDVYDVVATFTVEPPTGSNIAAVATNGIYLLGGTGVNQTDPLATILRFNTADNTIALLAKTLGKKSGAPAVVSYDDELLVFNGMESAPTGWVQKYNPTTDELLTSADHHPIAPSGSTMELQVNPIMTGTNTPAPYAVTDSGSISLWRYGWKAFDDDTSIGWGTSSNNEYLILDYGSTSLKTIVNRLRVHNDASISNQGMKSLTIEGADSAGGPWTLLGNVTVPESDVFNTVLNIPNTIPYQCYKITCTDNHGGVLAWVQREFRFYLAGVRKISPTMTSANAPAPASVVAQTEVGGSGWKIFDGNTATWWETSGVTSAWVRIDLGGVEIVDIIRVRGQGSGVAETTRHFKIQACNDDASWVDISGSLEKPKNGTWDIFCLSNTTPYRYYRFVNESVYGGSQIKCPEVEFYSTQPPPTESPLLPGAYMTKTLGDDNSTVILRHSHAGCMTPYGPVIGGGVTPSGATSSVQIYWPHAIASGTPADPPAVPPTPAFWYAFDEISGTTAADSSEGLHPGALTGFSAPGCWISGRHGNGLNFDGIDDHIPTAAPAVLTALNNITMAAWVKRTGSTGTNQMILVNGNTSTQGYALFIDSSGVVKVVCGGVGFADSGYSIVNDTWTHLAAVRVAGTWKMFVNGGEVAVTGNPVPNAISPGVTRVGCNQSGTEPFKGVLDDVVFYDRALPVTEIKALMDLGPVEPSTPLACLRFDETAGNTAVDSSGNGFDGTLNSMTSPGCWVAGRKNTCLAFDGSNDNVTLSALTGDIVSICFWMKEETTTLTDWSGPFCQAANDSSGFQFRSSALVAGCYSLKIGGSEYPTSIPDNDKAWKHIAIVKEGSATKIYYDGALNTTAAAVWTTAGAVRLGSNGLNDRWWNGKIDDLIIYDRVLSQVEIRKIMEGARPYFFGISRELPPMPGKRMNHSLVWHKDKLYRVGGSDGTNILATVDRFDPGTNVWVQLAQTALESDIADKSKFLDPSNLFKRQCAGACSFGNEIFIFGGENPAATLLTSAAAWNPETNRVRKVKEIPAQILWSGGSGNATKGINAVPVGPFIYLMGGSTGSNNGTSKQILRYRP